MAVNYVELVLDSLDLEFEMADVVADDLYREIRGKSEKERKEEAKQLCKLLVQLGLTKFDELDSCNDFDTILSDFKTKLANLIRGNQGPQFTSNLLKLVDKVDSEKLKEAIKLYAKKAPADIRKELYNELKVLSKAVRALQAVDLKDLAKAHAILRRNKDKILELIEKSEIDDKYKTALKNFVEGNKNPYFLSKNAKTAEKERLKIRQALKELKKDPKVKKLAEVLELEIKELEKAEKVAGKLAGNGVLAKIRRALARFFKEGTYLEAAIVALLGATLVVIALKMARVRIEPFNKMTWKLAWQRLGIPGKILLILGVVFILAGIYSAGLKAIRSLRKR